MTSSSSHIISQANEWRVLHPVYRGYEERLESQDQSGFRIDFIYFIKSQKVLFFFAPPVGQSVYYWKPATSCNMAVIQNHRDRVICLFLCRPKRRYGMATNYFTRWWIRLWAPHWYNSAIHGLYINNAFRHAMIKRKKY